MILYTNRKVVARKKFGALDFGRFKFQGGVSIKFGPIFTYFQAILT